MKSGLRDSLDCATVRSRAPEWVSGSRGFSSHSLGDHAWGSPKGSREIYVAVGAGKIAIFEVAALATMKSIP